MPGSTLVPVDMGAFYVHVFKGGEAAISLQTSMRTQTRRWLADFFATALKN